MLKIAVLEDSKKQCEALLSMLKDFQRKNPDKAMEVTAFSVASELLDYTEKNGAFELYLLDIIMEDMTGMDCAKFLRSKGDMGEIIFLTTSREYGVEAFEVNAAGYLMKPVTLNTLTEKLLAVYRRVDSKYPPVLVRLTNGGVKKLHLDDIVSVESFGKNQEICLKTGECLLTKGTLTEWKDRLLARPAFFSPHRSYLVNLEYVSSIGPAGIRVGEKNIPVSRRMQKTAQELLFNYILNKH